MTEIFIIMFSAIFIENLIFSKFYGCCAFMGVSDNPSTALGMGMAVSFVMTVSSAVTWVINRFIIEKFSLQYLRTIAFILVIAAIVQFIEMFLHKYMQSMYNSLGIFLPLITTNCAVFGSALICAQNNYSFVQTVVFNFAAAIGYTLALVIFAGVRIRLQFVEPPKSFKGIPLALITAGLIAMAFMGFSGMTLA